MNKPQTNNLIVTYTDGTHDHFKFPTQTDSFGMANLVEKLLSSNALALQVEDRLLIIPTANIRSAEIFPCPGKLPDIVMQNVQRLHKT
jgi:hypothetical protein